MRFEVPIETIDACLADDLSDELVRLVRRVGLGNLSRGQRQGRLPVSISLIAEAAAARVLGDLGFKLVWQLPVAGGRGVDLVL